MLADGSTNCALTSMVSFSAFFDDDYQDRACFMARISSDYFGDFVESAQILCGCKPLICYLMKQ